MIDFHTHIFPDKIAESTLEFLSQKCEITPHTNGMSTGLAASIENAEIDCSIILPVVTKPSQFKSINQFASQFLEGNMISFGGIHPDCDDYKSKILDIKHLGFKGIKLHPDYQQTDIDDIRYKRIISFASEQDLAVIVHAGFDPAYPDYTRCTPQKSAEMIKDVQPEKLILAHLGGFLMWDEVERYLVGLPVWFDTAVIFEHIKEEQFYRIVKNHGIDKILFATDSPWADQKKYVELISKLNFSDEEKLMITHTNAEKLLNMKINRK